jgi:hypothetical protein
VQILHDDGTNGHLTHTCRWTRSGSSPGSASRVVST